MAPRGNVAAWRRLFVALLALTGAVSRAAVVSVSLPVSFVRPTADARAINADADRPVALVALEVLPPSLSSSVSHARTPSGTAHMARVSAGALRNTVIGSGAHVLRVALDFGATPVPDTTALWLSDTSRLAVELQTAAARGEWVTTGGATNAALDYTHFTVPVNFGSSVKLRVPLAIVPAANVTRLAGEGSGAEAVLNLGPWSALWLTWPHGFWVPAARNALVLCATGADCADARLAPAPDNPTHALLHAGQCATGCRGELSLWALHAATAAATLVNATHAWSVPFQWDTRIARGTLGYLAVEASGATGDPFSGTAALRRCAAGGRISANAHCGAARLALHDTTTAPGRQPLALTSSQVETYFRPRAVFLSAETVGGAGSSDGSSESVVLGALAMWELCREVRYDALADRWTCRGADALAGSEAIDAALGAASLALLPTATVAHASLATVDRVLGALLLIVLALLGLVWLTGERHAASVTLMADPPRALNDARDMRLRIVVAGIVAAALIASLLAAIRANCCYSVRTGLFEDTDVGLIGIAALVGVVAGVLVMAWALVAAHAAPRAEWSNPVRPWARVYALGVVLVLCNGLLAALLPTAAHVPIAHVLLTLGLGAMTLALPLVYAMWGLGAAYLELCVPSAPLPPPPPPDALAVQDAIDEGTELELAVLLGRPDDDDVGELGGNRAVETWWQWRDIDDGRGVALGAAVVLALGTAAVVHFLLFTPVVRGFTDALLVPASEAPILALLLTCPLVFIIVTGMVLDLMAALRARLTALRDEAHKAR